TVSSGNKSVMFEWENDYFAASDRYYTNGMRLTRNFTRDDASGERVLAGAHLYQLMYTPTDITLEPDAVAANERPYAGVLAAGIYLGKLSSDDSRWRFDLDVGCLGPCSGAKQTQRTWHDLIDDDEPRGWSAQ